MSRSRKKHAVLKIGPVRKGWAKRQAAKKVRRQAGISNGGAFRKAFETWDVCDVIIGRDNLLNPNLRDTKRRK